MEKSPAFQFYPKDYLSDFNVRTMSWEQKGLYTELLCICWIENGIPKDMLEGWFNGGSTTLGPVLKCFYEKDGKYHHKRLDLERIKQQDWRDKSKEGGIRSGLSRRLHPVKRRNKITNEPPLNQTRTKGEPKGNSSIASSSSIALIINYLNEKASKSFKITTQSTRRIIKARIDEGFTVDQLKKVIDIKITKWRGKSWTDSRSGELVQGEDFLRPSTLFGPKFEEYLNEAPLFESLTPDQELKRLQDEDRGVTRK